MISCLWVFVDPSKKIFGRAKPLRNCLPLPLEKSLKLVRKFFKFWSGSKCLTREIV